MAASGLHARDDAARRTPDNWAAFVVVLCIAIVVDNASHPWLVWDAWVAEKALSNPGETLPRASWVLFALWTLLRPRSLVRYAVLCVVGSLVIVSMLPRVPNHWILELGVYLGSLLILATTREHAQRFSALRALLLGSIFAVYTWAFLHKLNWGFVDPDVSCSAVFLDSLADRLGFRAPTDLLRAGAVYSVLLAEGAMPFLLLGSRSRGVAILLGIGLHSMFGLFVSGFSLFMWASYFMLLPTGSLEPARVRATQARAWTLGPIPARLRDVHVPRWMRQTAGFAVLLIAVLLIKQVPRLGRLPQHETLLIPAAIVLGGLLLWGLFVCRMKLPITLPPRNVLAVAWLLPLLLLLNGAVPYLGVRNTLAFSMFSNLRTEDGQSNHWFLPSVETPVSVLHDPITVLDTSDPVLRKYTRPQHRVRWNWTALIAKGVTADFELPFFLVRYRATEVRDSGAPMFSIRFRRDGTVHELSPEEVDALPPVSNLAAFVHWSKATPLPPHRNACMW